MTGRPEFWRGLLLLGRVSNLPTVWSNCFAGWLLGGGGSCRTLTLLLLGATLLYVGGMYLNDAIDVDFDRQHRRERPIPSGLVPERTVWRFALALLGAGLLVFLAFPGTVAVLALLLLVNIVVYDLVHKSVALAPLIMAGCRVWLFLLASSTGVEGVSGYAVWCALVLGAYVLGLSLVARRESLSTIFSWWPLAPLALPVVLALVINNGSSRTVALLVSGGVIAWLFICLRHLFWTAVPNASRTVGGLIAGIVLTDILAVFSHSTSWSLLPLACLFILAILLQRFVPAT